MRGWEQVADKLVFEPMAVIFTIGMAALIFIGIPFGLYSWATYQPPETFELRVDSWVCTKSHVQEREVCSKGCRWYTETICDQWSAK